MCELIGKSIRRILNNIHPMSRLNTTNVISLDGVPSMVFSILSQPNALGDNLSHSMPTNFRCYFSEYREEAGNVETFRIIIAAEVIVECLLLVACRSVSRSVALRLPSFEKLLI